MRRRYLFSNPNLKKQAKSTHEMGQVSIAKEHAILYKGTRQL